MKTFQRNGSTGLFVVLLLGGKYGNSNCGQGT